jgi:hypothetical protein
MRSTALIAALLGGSIVSAAADPAPVAARMRHIDLHMGKGVDLRIDDLRGRLTSRNGGPPVFDDVQSYVVDVDYARVAMSGPSLTNLMNNFVFASNDAPIKKIAIAIEGNELVQSGVLKKGVPIPFKMRAAVSLAPDGRLRIHPTSMKAAGFVSKRVLDFFGLELEKLVDVKDSPGLAVDGDDLLLDAARALPPPRMRGKPSRVWIENGQMQLQFGDPSARGIDPPLRSARNYMYYKGGTLKFGKLTMEDADLLLTDADPRDPFDFSPERYNDQLVAGYSKNTRAHGLIVHMPDANKINSHQAAVSDRVTAAGR